MAPRILPTEPGSGKVERLIKKTAAITLIAFGAATLSACADNPGPEPTVSSSTATPTAETPTPTPVETEIPQVMPENLEQYDNMDFNEFDALTKEEQQPLREWLMRDLSNFAKEYYEAQYAPRSELNILPSNGPNADSTPQDAAFFANTYQRMSMSLSGLDAQKALVASFCDPHGTGAERYTRLSNDLREYDQIRPGKGLTASEQSTLGYLPALKIIETGEPTNNGTLIEFKAIDNVGQPLSGELCYIPPTEHSSDPSIGSWLM